jgi:hypothetical protein
MRNEDTTRTELIVAQNVDHLFDAIEGCRSKKCHHGDCTGRQEKAPVASR